MTALYRAKRKVSRLLEEKGRIGGLSQSTVWMGLLALIAGAMFLHIIVNYIGPEAVRILEIFGFAPYEEQAVNAVEAMTYATNCAALANAWNPDLVSDANPVAQKFDSKCGSAKVSSYGARYSSGVLKGKKFGDVTVQCISAPNDVKSGCNVYNATLPQNLAQSKGKLPSWQDAANPNHWLGQYEAGYGDPRYLMYYQQYPQEESSKWDSRKMADRWSVEAILISVAIEAAFEFDAGVRRVTGNFLRGVYTGGKSYIRDTASSAVNRIFRYSGGTTEAETAIVAARKGSDRTTRESVQKIYKSVGRELGDRAARKSAEDGATAVRYFSTEAAPLFGREGREVTSNVVDDIYDTVPAGISRDELITAHATTLRKYGDEISEKAESKQSEAFIQRFRQVLDEDLGKDDASGILSDLGVSNVGDAWGELQDTTADELLQEMPEHSAEIADATLAAYAKSTGDELTVDEVAAELPGEVTSSSWWSRIRPNLGDFLSRWKNVLDIWSSALESRARMSLAYSARATRRTVIAMDAARAHDGRVVRQIVGDSGDNTISDVNWNKLFSTIDGTNYYKQAAEDIVESGETISRRQASRILIVGRMRYTDTALDYMDKSARRKVIDAGVYAGQAAMSTTGGRWAVAEAMGELIGDGPVEQEDYKAIGRCSAAPSRKALIGCLGMVMLGMHHVRQIEQSDQFNNVGHAMAVDRNQEYIPPLPRDLMPEVNWFMPALPVKEDPRFGETPNAGPSLAFERRFRLASPCYTDVVRIRHEEISGHRTLGYGTLPGSNAPSYLTQEDWAEIGGINKVTLLPRIAKHDENGDPVYVSKGAFWVGGDHKINDQQYYYFTRGTMASMTGQTKDEMLNGASPAPPGYRMQQASPETSGSNVWNGMIQAEGANSILVRDGDSFVKKPAASQINITKERMGNLLWHGTTDPACGVDRNGVCRVDTSSNRNSCGASKVNKNLCGPDQFCCTGARSSSAKGIKDIIESNEDRITNDLYNTLTEMADKIEATGKDGSDIHAQQIREIRDHHMKGYRRWKWAVKTALGQNETFPLSGMHVRAKMPDWNAKFYNLFIRGWGEEFTGDAITVTSIPVDFSEPTPGTFGDLSYANYLTHAGGLKSDMMNYVQSLYLDHYRGNSEIKKLANRQQRILNQFYIRIGPLAYNNLDYLPKPDGASGSGEYYKKLSKNVVKQDHIPRSYMTPSQVGTKTFTSRTISEGVKKWVNNNIFGIFSFAFGGTNWERPMQTQVEGLVYHVTKKDPQNIPAIPSGANYCYGVDPYRDDFSKWTLGFFYGFSIPFELGAELVGAYLGGPVGAKAGAMASTAVVAVGRQALQNYVKKPWPQAE